MVCCGAALFATGIALQFTFASATAEVPPLNEAATPTPRTEMTAKIAFLNIGTAGLH
jgi:hypothetical protein